MKAPFILFAAFLTIAAQDAGGARFEAVSIKPRSGGPGGGAQSSPDRYVATNQTLRDLIEFAYDRQRFEIIGGPSWVTTERFDVNAKAGFAPPPAQMRLMLQAVLADRFKLRTHVESREMASYVLSLANRNGALGKNLTRTTVSCDAIELARRNGDPSAPKPRDGAGRPVCSEATMARPLPDNSGVVVVYHASGITLDEFAQWLGPALGRPVVNATGLNGDFDLEVAYDPAEPTAASAEPGAASAIFNALRDQLGLTLQSEKRLVKVLIVDGAEPPTPD